MRLAQSSLLFAVVALVFGCDNTEGLQKEEDNAVARNTPVQEESVEPTSETPAPDNAALVKRGSIVFLRCRSCHTTEQDGVHLTGPNLHGLIGATAGQKPGYAFSDALASSNIVWNTTALDEWLHNPSGYIPQNRMVFAGLPNESDRTALIAFLADATQ